MDFFRVNAIRGDKILTSAEMFLHILYLYISDLFISHHAEMDIVKSAAFHVPKCSLQQHNVTGIHLAVILFGTRWFMLEIVIFCTLL